MPWGVYTDPVETDDGLLEHTGAMAQSRRHPLTNRVRRWLDDVRSRSPSPEPSPELAFDRFEPDTLPRLEYYLSDPVRESIACFDDLFPSYERSATPTSSANSSPRIPHRPQMQSRLSLFPPVPSAPVRPPRPAGLQLDPALPIYFAPAPAMLDNPALRGREARPRTARGEDRGQLQGGEYGRRLETARMQRRSGQLLSERMK